MLGAVIGAGANLVGSLFGAGMARAENRENNAWNANQANINRKFQTNRENVAWKRTVAEQKRQEQVAMDMSDPAMIRKRFEDAGYNPLLATGAMGMPGVPNGPVSQTAGAPGTPSALMSGAGEIVANGFANFGNAFLEMEALAIQREQLAMENQALRENATRMMIAPPAPSVYDRQANNESSVDYIGPRPADAGDDSGTVKPLAEKRETIAGENVYVPTDPMDISELMGWMFLENVGRAKQIYGNVRSGSAWEADKQRLNKAADWFQDVRRQDQERMRRGAQWVKDRTVPMPTSPIIPDGIALPTLPLEAPDYRELKEYLN